MRYYIITTMINFDISVIIKLESINKKLFDRNLIRLLYSFCVDINVIDKINFIKNDNISNEDKIRKCKQYCIDNEVFDIINKMIYYDMTNDKDCNKVKIFVEIPTYKYFDIRHDFDIIIQTLKEQYKGIKIVIIKENIRFIWDDRFDYIT